MTITKESEKILNNIINILYGACHAPNCKHISKRKCPISCGCRTERKFKLNTETAMCWEIANQIYNILRFSRPTKQDVQKVISIADSSMMLSQYHMTRGWHSFFSTIFRLLQMILVDQMSFYVSRDLSSLKRSLPRLKREPK